MDVARVDIGEKIDVLPVNMDALILQDREEFFGVNISVHILTTCVFEEVLLMCNDMYVKKTLKA